LVRSRQPAVDLAALAKTQTMRAAMEAAAAVLAVLPLLELNLQALEHQGKGAMAGFHSTVNLMQHQELAAAAAAKAPQDRTQALGRAAMAETV
jgi:hypothetical protein